MLEVYDDYQINQVELESKTDSPNIIFMILSSFFSIGANAGLVLLLFIIIPGLEVNLISIPIAFGLGFGIFIAGLIGGWVWEKLGVLIARSFYAAYIPELKNNTISKIYRRFIDSDNKIFVEARSKDQRLSNIKGMFGLIFRISISELSFFILITSIIVIPLGGVLSGNWSFYDEWKDFIDPFIALGISVVILAFYLPMSFILQDAHIKTFDTKNRILDTPGSKIRSIIDGVVGVGAISTGYSLFESVRPQLSEGYFLVQGNTVGFAIDYILWLFFIMVISWPLIFPATLFFFLRYQKTVNRFRTDAIRSAIPIGVTLIREPIVDENPVIEKYLETN